MRNKHYVAAAAVPAVLLLWWALSLWWKDSAVMALIVGAVAVALGVAAYRISKAASFAPVKQSKWDSSRSAGVNDWLDAQSSKGDPPSTKH